VDATITRKNAQVLVREWHTSPIDKGVLHLDHEAFDFSGHIFLFHQVTEQRSITPLMGLCVAIVRCVGCIAMPLP
jgi:hypothetical protein